MFNKICIVGVGLIGSSLARGIKEKNLARCLVGYDDCAQVRKKVQELNFVHQVSSCLDQAVDDADVVVLCVPVSKMKDVVSSMSKSLKHGAILTDVGSVKEDVIEQVISCLPSHVSFVPGHPIAGTEKTGPENGFSSVFQGRYCLITPWRDGDKQQIQTIKCLWENVGMNVKIMTPKEHDRVLAMTSHLPHLIAYTLVGTAQKLEQDQESHMIEFSAGGFRDFTRICESSPQMWRDIMLKNKMSLLDLLDQFQYNLDYLRKSIENDDAQVLYDWFSKARRVRSQILDLEKLYHKNSQ